MCAAPRQLFLAREKEEPLHHDKVAALRRGKGGYIVELLGTVHHII